MESFRHLAGNAGDLTRDTLFGAAMFEDQARFERKTLFQENQRTVIAYAERDDFDCYWFSLQRNVNTGTNAKENPVAPTPLLAGNLLLLGQCNCFNR
jgi:hypothetical protein